MRSLFELCLRLRKSKHILPRLVGRILVLIPLAYAKWLEHRLDK